MNVRPLLVGLVIAAGGAGLAHLLHFPVPWLLGPLLCTAVARINGAPAASHPWIRRAGQWCIGTSVGLYFMPEVALLLITHAPAILGCIAFTLSFGALNGYLLYRFGGVDLPTAWYAGAIGSASEMANLAARQDAEIDKVASAHSLRVFMVVVSVPFVCQWLGIQGDDSSALLRPQAIRCASSPDAGSAGVQTSSGRRARPPRRVPQSHKHLLWPQPGVSGASRPDCCRYPR